MSLRWPSRLRSTAAWRISLWTTLAFAACSAVAFAIVYLVVARGMRERTDAWLLGEAEVLAEVSSSAMGNDAYDRLVEEVAELAAREVPQSKTSTQAESGRSVFFLLTRGKQEPVWMGPRPKNNFLHAIGAGQFSPAVPQTVTVTGWPQPFRVVYHPISAGAVYLGFADIAGEEFLRRITERFIAIWLGMVALGFAISFSGAFRTLQRVERITETVAGLGSDDLDRRLPEVNHRDEISRLSQTFNHMLDRVQASCHQLLILTDSLAHDLKSPVTSIRGTLEVALSEAGGNWRELVADAVDKLDGLSQTLNTALDLAEADAGTLPVRREFADLGELVRQFVGLYQPAMADRGHELVCSIPGQVLINADFSLLSRTIANLLDNEVAHLPAGCRVEIGLRENEAEVELTVKDNGPGFPLEVRNRLFERFVKGQRSTGHGLGLAFVNAAVQAHGGRIDISDGEGSGTVIRVALPRARAAAA